MVPFDFPGPPSPNGYSNVVTIDSGSRLVWTSGQVAAGPDGVVPRGWAEQTRQVFRNLGAALETAGATWADVVKLTFYVVDTAELPTVRAVRDEFVNLAAPPTSSLIRVAGLLSPEFLIEVEAVAVI
ncbi:RidA family protein [Actinoplanes teichomyceticus]|uniref:Enamine deaminase RidA (YjgF/YER057c/UK114 family) n=1 Tax=Actinoplanes teichomyceticus TaxID=1867 RepID=A0A561VC42_ACTTI|nr:RidA family protein [Actinoplanes teichomyceticus]TWG09190.1 enamine deaminase RidA (YjgF/YER057c/UK114 family) [Actinoplanes teichomyceticus]GIF14047.1 enamine deaminase RidA [Actinoplanes teichomyceticus]